MAVMAGSSLPEGINAIKTGSFTPTSASASYTITHNLGVQCQGIVVWCDNIGSKNNQGSYTPVFFISAKFTATNNPSTNRMQIAGRYVSSNGNLLGISKEDSTAYMTSTIAQFRSVTGMFAPTIKDSSGTEVAAIYKWVAWG